jgi:ribonuclease Z
MSETNRQANINPLAITQYSLSVNEIKRVKENKSIWREGKEIGSHQLTLPPKPLRKFAYCSDTIYDEEIIQYIKGANLIYHEATYLHDLATKARERMHSTAYEAASIAYLAKAETLVIGHYSSRYRVLAPFLDEAKQKFENTHLAIEGSKYSVGIT